MIKALPYSGIHNIDNISFVGLANPSNWTLEVSRPEGPFRVDLSHLQIKPDFLKSRIVLAPSVRSDIGYYT